MDSVAARDYRPGRPRPNPLLDVIPFPVSCPQSAGGPWDKLFSTFRTRGERSDIVANILLFVPLGLFLMLSSRRPRWWDAVITTAAAALLSTTRRCFSTMTKAGKRLLSDVYSNTAGACLGAVAGILCYRKFRAAAAGTRNGAVRDASAVMLAGVPAISV